MKTELFLSVLEISITIGLVALLLVLCAPVINRRYGARWKCWIWLLLALRLVIPLSAEDVRSATALLAEVISGESKGWEIQKGIFAVENADSRQVIFELPAQVREKVGAQSGKNGTGITWLELAGYVWAAGGISFAAFHLSAYFYYRRQIEKKGRTVRGDAVLSQMPPLLEELHIKREIPVREYPGAVSPMIAGFFKPVLVLPPEQYGEEELYFILKHELIHFKRRDVWFKLLLMLANALHWFNPFIWLMHREAIVDMELACDERVVQGKGYRIRKAYTETLFSTLRGRKNAGTTLSTQFYGGKMIMKKRFRNILKMKRKKNGILVLTGVILLAAGMGAMVGCSVAADNPEPVSPVAADNPEPVSPVAMDDSVQDRMTAEFIEEEIPPESGDGESDKETATAGDTATLLVPREGEAEEENATLFAGEGYSIYLTADKWQQSGEDAWQAVLDGEAVLDGQVTLRIAHPNGKGADQIAKELTAEGYGGMDESGDTAGVETAAGSGSQLDGSEWFKAEKDMVHMITLKEAGEEVWQIICSFPVEAQEGWGQTLRVMAASFAADNQ